MNRSLSLPLSLTLARMSIQELTDKADVARLLWKKLYGSVLTPFATENSIIAHSKNDETLHRDTLRHQKEKDRIQIMDKTRMEKFNKRKRDCNVALAWLDAANEALAAAKIEQGVSTPEPKKRKKKKVETPSTEPSQPRSTDSDTTCSIVFSSDYVPRKTNS